MFMAFNLAVWRLQRINKRWSHGATLPLPALSIWCCRCPRAAKMCRCLCRIHLCFTPPKKVGRPGFAGGF